MCVYVCVCRPDFACVALETIKKKNPPLGTRHDASRPLEGTRDREMCPRFFRAWGTGAPAVKAGPSSFSRGVLALSWRGTNPELAGRVRLGLQPEASSPDSLDCRGLGELVGVFLPGPQLHPRGFHARRGPSAESWSLGTYP